VYTVTGRFDGRSYTGLVSIGTNPTFAKGGVANPRTVEVWLLDFALTIYGAQLELRDFRFVREQRTFASVEELERQIQADAALVRYPSFQMNKS
jgi:riboflavin kinase/FMN adenylyltransferase